MANLTETPLWESGIYQLETSDPVMGGVDGIDNRQAKQLANRTAWLKQQQEKLETLQQNLPISTGYSPTRHYQSGELVFIDGIWYECYRPEGAMGKDPRDAIHRPSGWQITDPSQPYYWLKIGKWLNFPEVGTPIALPSTQLREGIIKYRNDGQLHKDKFYRIAESYPNLVNGNILTIADLRGEFIRGLDDGRGIDTNRTLLSQQNDAIRNITGKFTLGVHSSGRSSFSGANYAADSVQDMAVNNGTLASSRLVGFDASLVVPIANENRPRNIAFLYGMRI